MPAVVDTDCMSSAYSFLAAQGLHFLAAQAPHLLAAHGLHLFAAQALQVEAAFGLQALHSANAVVPGTAAARPVPMTIRASAFFDLLFM